MGGAAPRVLNVSSCGGGAVSEWSCLTCHSHLDSEDDCWVRILAAMRDETGSCQSTLHAAR